MLILLACADEMKDTPADDRVLAQASVSASEAGPWSGPLDLLQKSTNLWEVYVGEGVVTIDTPTGVDLASIVDAEVTLDVADGNAVITDEAGPLYVLATGAGDPAVSLFGAGVVEKGETIGTFYEMGWQVDFGAIEFDGAPVGPGSVETVTIGAASFRATTIAALTVTRYSDAASKCGPADTLSYELLRVAEPAPEEDRTRPVDDEYARVGCG